MCLASKETVNFKISDGMLDIILSHIPPIDIFPQISTIISFFVILDAHISEC